MDVKYPEMHNLRVTEEPQSILQIRLKAIMAARKVKAAPLAVEAGLSPSFVRDILRGKTKSPRADSLDKIAEALDTTAEYLLGKVEAPGLEPTMIVRTGAPVIYAGIIQAGLWRSVDEYFDQDPESVPEFVLPVEKFRKAKQYAWRALGDSMNEAGIHEGMWVVGADASDYVDFFGDIVTGDLVVAERTRYQGGERELTVKEIHYFRDRYELRPMSTNKTHQAIVVPHDFEVSSDGVEVKIIGLVLTAYADLRRPRNRGNK